MKNPNYSLHFTVYRCIIRKKECIMDVKTYKITKIEGEYAYLVDECGEELFIAMALLPLGADIGVNLKCENFEFTVLE